MFLCIYKSQHLTLLLIRKFYLYTAEKFHIFTKFPSPEVKISCRNWQHEKENHFGMFRKELPILPTRLTCLIVFIA